VASANYLRKKLLTPVMQGDEFEVYESNTLYCITANHAVTGERCTVWLHKVQVEKVQEAFRPI
jgi:hypothetical protein